MGINPLVSIISPCYNSERFVGRMLDSILKQTYGNIEMICVNDGSTDMTAQVIESYYSRFKSRNMSLKLINQDNQGQASALNNALKLITGDYLCWIDSDDFLAYNSIEVRLEILEKNKEYGVCTSDLYIVNEDNINKIIRRNIEYFGHLNYQRNQFYLTVIGLSSIECHAHMIRMSYFDKIIPDREISCCRAGQNYQMLLPMYYNFPRYYVDEPLGYYVIRKDSHYHKERTREKEMIRQTELLEMLEMTLKKLNIPSWNINLLLNISYFHQKKESCIYD